MDKYVVIFCIPAAAMQDWMAAVDEATRTEQSNQVMNQWKEWVDAHADAIVDQGMPLGKTKRVTKDGIEDVKNDMNWMMVIETESPEAAAELVQSNPHLQMIPSSYVEVMRVSRTGM